MEKNEIKNKWKVKDKRFVAFLDILGFKDWISRSSHEEIYDKLSKISYIRLALEKLTDNYNSKNIDYRDINIVSFSDSIVIFSKDDSLENFKHFLFSVVFLFTNAIENGIPIKGGAAYGEVSLNKSEQIYFGQPIIDAYLIEEDVNYLCITLHNSLDKYIDDNWAEISNKEIDYLLFECKTPLKSGLIEHRNVDWFDALALTFKIDKDTYEREEVIKLIKSFRHTASGSPRRYIDNTLEVFAKKREISKI